MLNGVNGIPVFSDVCLNHETMTKHAVSYQCLTWLSSRTRHLPQSACREFVLGIDRSTIQHLYSFKLTLKLFILRPVYARDANPRAMADKRSLVPQKNFILGKEQIKHLTSKSWLCFAIATKYHGLILDSYLITELLWGSMERVWLHHCTGEHHWYYI